MNKNKVWFITGAGRGIGAEFARAALVDGNKVVASGRNKDELKVTLGEHDNLLIVELDVTKPDQAQEAIENAVARFGTVDVLVNNAASFFGGYFEELTNEQIEKQLAINLYGPMNVTRAVLPVMRKAGSGHIISISSLAGLVGYEYNAAYCTSKFALEGWMESLHHDVGPFGIHTTIVEPGFFRTGFLEKKSTFWAENPISDYIERNKPFRSFFADMNGKQVGDPKKLAKALLEIVALEEPPSRWLAGADAIAGAEEKVAELTEQINAYRHLSKSLACDE